MLDISYHIFRQPHWKDKAPPYLRMPTFGYIYIYIYIYNTYNILYQLYDIYMIY